MAPEEPKVPVVWNGNIPLRRTLISRGISARYWIVLVTEVAVASFSIRTTKALSAAVKFTAPVTSPIVPVVNVKTLVEANINAYLDTATQPYPNPDMIIRTGGEQRSSGFMLWQAAYTEYFFTGTLLPDLTPDIVDDLLEQYATRQRRFGA